MTFKNKSSFFLSRLNEEKRPHRISSFTDGKHQVKINLKKQIYIQIQWLNNLEHSTEWKRTLALKALKYINNLDLIKDSSLFDKPHFRSHSMWFCNLEIHCVLHINSWIKAKRWYYARHQNSPSKTLRPIIYVRIIQKHKKNFTQSSLISRISAYGSIYVFNKIKIRTKTVYYPSHRSPSNTLHIYSIYTNPLKGTLDKTHRKTVKRKYYFQSIKLGKIPMEEPFLHKRNGRKKILVKTSFPFYFAVLL